MAILEVEHIHKSFGRTEVLKDVSFSLKQAPVVSYLPKDIINTIYNSEDGYIYVGSDGGGLLRMAWLTIPMSS